YLNVVGLLESLGRAILHEARVRISEIALTLCYRHDFPGGRNLPFPPPLASLPLARWLFFLRTLMRGGGFSFGLHVRDQAANFGQPRLRITQLFRQLVTTFALAVELILLLVYALGLAQQTFHFSRQLWLYILHPGIGKRLILRGVGF